MSALLHHRELTYLADWAARSDRKPLIIRGARQVGKSTLVRQFVESSELSLRAINFERNPAYSEAFASNDPAQIQTVLGLPTIPEVLRTDIKGRIAYWRKRQESNPPGTLTAPHWF